MEPIQKLAKEVMDGNTERWEKMLTSLQIVLKTDERLLEGKKLLKCIM